MSLIKSLALAALITTTTAFADHLDTVCESAITSAPTWEENLIAYRANGENLVTTHQGMIIGSAPSAIKGMFQDNLSIWILTKSQLLEMNAGGEILNEYLIEWTGNPAWQALSMVKANNMIVIGRGAGGLLGFDLTTREIAWTNWMKGDDDGYPSGVAFDGQNVYAATATSMENGFTGIITVNPADGTITKRSKYDVPRWGVLDTDAKAIMNGDSLILNNGGWIHVITKKQIESDKAIRPRWVAQMIPQDGPVNAHYMTLLGNFVIHDGYVMGCGAYTTQDNGVFVRKSKLFHVKLP